MATLKYITRGKQTAQGKQKVYFCAHPDDHGVYLDKISNEILDTLAKAENYNCAFFYLEDAYAERDGEFIFSFKEMNLIVMPVTTKLLTTANPALDIEFKLAVENGIPVLPIMMESGLVDVFNAKCGDLQFLDPNAHDATAISYEEKLTKFLTSVLIGDETAEKIRAAFDAYIFLSYRKKDREYAQQLMRLIHKNDFCRDIAIWYDEFLTPGENFNREIKSALNKSKLFALAVTPNLVNEINYVMTVEYKMAKKAKKLILPTEFVNTDKKLLAKKYKGIPECIRSNDEPALSASLEKALRGIALRENDNDPEHNFFIGLAYLGGIDVERDTARAVALITSSAEAGVPEAIEKLVSIYRNGEAGARDYNKAIEWQKKLVEIRRRKHLEVHDEDSAIVYLSAIWDLGDYIYELRHIDNAKKVYEDMLAASEDINAEFKESWTIRYLSVVYNKLGGVYNACGKIDKAEEYYRKSLAIREGLADETGTENSLRDLSVSCNNLGDICSSLGKSAEAEEYYRRALAIRERLAAESGTPEAMRDLLVSYNYLGDTLIKLEMPEEAWEYYQKSLGIAERLEREIGTLTAMRDLSVTYDRLGNICVLCGEPTEAEQYYLRSLDIRERLAKELGTVESLRDLSISYEKLAEACKILGRPPEAEKYRHRSLDIAQKLAEETGTVESYNDLAVLYYEIALVSREHRVEYLSKALDIWTKLAEDIPTVPDYADRRDTVRRILAICRR